MMSFIVVLILLGPFKPCLPWPYWQLLARVVMQHVLSEDTDFVDSYFVQWQDMHLKTFAISPVWQVYPPLQMTGFLPDMAALPISIFSFTILHRPHHPNLLDLMEVDTCQNKNRVSPHCLPFHQGMLQYQPIQVCYFESTPLYPMASICELENWWFCAMEKTLIWHGGQLSHGLCMNPWFPIEECRNWWRQFYSMRYLQI